jgi:putative phosphoesterase
VPGRTHPAVKPHEVTGLRRPAARVISTQGAKVCKDLQMALAAHTRIGLISDTHGLLRPSALEFLRGCSHVVHGGDIGGAAILDELARIAPVTAVRGNNDSESWAEHLAESEFLQIEGVRIFAIHDLKLMRIDPTTARARVVVSGHSHHPLIEERHGVLFVNPGSAGPKRFKLPISVGELTISATAVTARLVGL